MDVWYIGNKEQSTLLLWRTDGACFRVIQAGEYPPLVVNGLHTLIDRNYAVVFDGLGNQLSINPVMIYDYQSGTENCSYIELKISNDITPETIKTVDSSGRRIWTYDGNIFVSGDLKRDLFKIGFQELSFHLGFSAFGG